MLSYEYIWKPISMTQIFAYPFNLDLCYLLQADKFYLCLSWYYISYKIYLMGQIHVLLNSGIETFAMSQD